MDSDVKIGGLSELQDYLDQLPVNIEKKICRGALRAGQKVVADFARQMAPVAPPNAENQRLYGGYAGALRDSIRVTTRSRRGRVTATVKAGDATAYYANMVEFGTAAHFIKHRNAKSLFFAGLFREGVDHPGAQKRPFMRPALDYAAMEDGPALQAVVAYLRTRINKELAKLPDEADGTTK